MDEAGGGGVLDAVHHLAAVRDFQHGIVTKRTLKGEEVFTLGYPVESEAYKPKDKTSAVVYRPTNVAVAPANPGMSTATAITSMSVNGVFMSLPPHVSISTMSVEEP